VSSKTCEHPQKWGLSVGLLTEQPAGEARNKTRRATNPDPDVRPVTTDQRYRNTPGESVRSKSRRDMNGFSPEEHPAPHISAPIGGTPVNGGRRYTTRAQTPGLLRPTSASDPVHVHFRIRFTRHILNRAIISDTKPASTNPRGEHPPLHCFAPGRSRRVPWDRNVLTRFGIERKK